jgi:hypothetical protein
MEHRHGKRIAIDQGAVIDARPRAVGRGRVVDISLTGLYVRTTLVLPVLARVRLRFVARTGDVLSRQRIGAYVARRGPDGLGLAWAELDPSVRVLLLASLRRWRSSGPAPTASAPHDPSHSVRAPAFDSTSHYGGAPTPARG